MNINKQFRISLFLFMLLFVFSINIFADYLILLDGKEYNGKLVKIDSEKVYFKTGDEIKIFKKSEILELSISKKRLYNDITNLKDLKDKLLVYYLEKYSFNNEYDLPYVIFYDGEEVKIENNKTVVEYTKIIKVYDKSGIDLASTYYMYDPDISNMEIVYAFSVSTDGKIHHIDDTMIQRYNYHILKDYDEKINVLKFAIPDVKVGSFIVYKVKKTYKKLYTNIYREFFAINDDPVVDKVLKIQIYRDQELKLYKFYSDKYIKLNSYFKGKYRFYEFKTSYPYFLSYEPYSLSKYDIYPHIIIMTKDRSSIEDFMVYLTSTKTASEFNSTLKKVAREALKMYKEEYKIVHYIFKWVDDNIRTIYVYNNYSAFHSPSYILRKKKASKLEKLLIAYNILKYTNLDVKLLPVHSYKDGIFFNKHNISLYNFNSYVFKINNVYYEPLNYRLLPGKLSEHYYYSTILDNNNFITFKNYNLDDFKVESWYKIFLPEKNNSNRVKIEVKIEFSNIIADYYRYIAMKNKELLYERVKNTLMSFFPDYTLEDFKVENIKDISKKFILKFKFYTDYYLLRNKKSLFLNFVFSKRDVSWLGSSKRYTPIFFNGQKEFNITHFEIYTPKNVIINYIPDYSKYNFSIAGVSSLSVNYLWLGSFISGIFNPDYNVYLFDVIFTRDGVLIAPELYKSLKRLYENCNLAAFSYISFKILK